MSFENSLCEMRVPESERIRFEFMADHYMNIRHAKQDLEQQLRDRESDRKRAEKQIKRFMSKHKLKKIKNDLPFMPDFYWTKRGAFCFQEDQPK